MKYGFLTFGLAVAIAGCSIEESSTVDAPAVGADRDENGCIASAGYQWCAATKQCERPWELAESTGIENTGEAFKKYCGG